MVLNYGCGRIEVTNASCGWFSRNFFKFGTVNFLIITNILAIDIALWACSFFGKW